MDTIHEPLSFSLYQNIKYIFSFDEKVCQERFPELKSIVRVYDCVIHFRTDYSRGYEGQKTDGGNRDEKRRTRDLGGS